MADYVGPTLRGGSARSRRLAAALGIAVVLAGTLLAAIGADASRSTDGGQPAPAAVQQAQAQWDGKGSQRLPVKVAPDVGLLNGQVVRVKGAGFPAGASVAAVMCTMAAGSQGIEACDIGTSSYLAGTMTIADPDGQFTIDYPVRRFIQVGGKTVDCLTANVDPVAYGLAVAVSGPWTSITTKGAFSCLVAAGMINDYDVSGGALVALAGETFLPFDVEKTPPPSTSSLPRSTRGPAARGGSSDPTTSIAAPDTDPPDPPDSADPSPGTTPTPPS
jgi:hypothetical protein